MSRCQVAGPPALSAGREAHSWPSLACWECPACAGYAGENRREAAWPRLEAAKAAESEEVVIRSEVGSERSRWEKDTSVPLRSRLYHESDRENRPYSSARRVSRRGWVI